MKDLLGGLMIKVVILVGIEGVVVGVGYVIWGFLGVVIFGIYGFY